MGQNGRSSKNLYQPGSLSRYSSFLTDSNPFGSEIRWGTKIVWSSTSASKRIPSRILATKFWSGYPSNLRRRKARSRFDSFGSVTSNGTAHALRSNVRSQIRPRAHGSIAACPSAMACGRSSSQLSCFNSMQCSWASALPSQVWTRTRACGVSNSMAERTQCGGTAGNWAGMRGR